MADGADLVATLIEHRTQDFQVVVQAPDGNLLEITSVGWGAYIEAHDGETLPVLVLGTGSLEGQ